MGLLTGIILGVVLLAVPGGDEHASSKPDPELIERGVKVYAGERCRTCHAIDGQGNRRYPLDGVGSRLTREEIRTWIVAPREMDPRVRKRAYDKLSQDDLDGLIAYMQSLKDES